MRSVSFFFSSRRRHTRWTGDWSSDVCSSDLVPEASDSVARTGLLSTRENVSFGSSRTSPTTRTLTRADVVPAGRGSAEIGRAACRGRGEISGGGGGLKKKNEAGRRWGDGEDS